MSEISDLHLLDDIKAYLPNVTDDSVLSGIVQRGKARLQEIAGAPLCFSEEGLARSLLFDYCRYADSRALEVFETNFQAELLELHLKGRLQDGNQDADKV